MLQLSTLSPAIAVINLQLLFDRMNKMNRTRQKTREPGSIHLFRRPSYEKASMSHNDAMTPN
jgi:hypothetical protein